MKVVVSISLFVSLIGVVMGPISWIMSYTYQINLHEFQNGGIETEGIVRAKREWKSGKAYKNYIDVQYTNPEREEAVVAEDVEIEGLYYDAIKVSEKIPLLFKNGKVVAVDDFKNEFAPPIRKKYWGMVLTLFSFSFLTYRVLDTKRKKARGEIPG